MGRALSWKYMGEGGLRMKDFFHLHRRKLVFILFLILFIFGIANIGDYGMPWDECTEVSILLANAKEYMLQIFPEGSKIHGLAELIYGEPISRNIERDHGIAAYYGFLPLMYLTNYEHPATMYAWHIYTYLLWFLGLICLYFLLNIIAIYGCYDVFFAFCDYFCTYTKGTM